MTRTHSSLPLLSDVGHMFRAFDCPNIANMRITAIRSFTSASKGPACRRVIRAAAAKGARALAHPSDKAARFCLPSTVPHGGSGHAMAMRSGQRAMHGHQSSLAAEVAELVTLLQMSACCVGTAMQHGSRQQRRICQ